MRHSLMLLALILTLAGCGWIFKDPIYPGIQSGHTTFSTDGRTIKSEFVSEGNENYRVYKVLIPLQDGSGIVSEIKLFESKKPGKKKFVVVTPIYGSIEYPPMVMAARLTLKNEKADFNVAVIREKGDLFDWDALASAKTKEELRLLLGKSTQRLLQAVREVQTVLDWAENEPAVDTSGIGIAGFSLGCMVSTIAMGIDWRISAGAFIMCGGDLPEIFMASEAPLIKRARRNAIERLGFTEKELRNSVASILSSVEPTVFARHIPPDRVVLVEAKFDTFLPLFSREALWQAMRRPGSDPLRIALHSSHKMSFLYMTPLRQNYLDKKIAAFFREKL